jgi:hypothetical protein
MLLGADTIRLICDVGYVYIQEVEFERLDVFMGIVSYAIQSLKQESAPLVQKLLPLLYARFQQVPLP